MDAQQRFTVLWQAHHGAVLRYARRRTDAESAADVVSETFLVAWRRLGDIPADLEQTLPWLYGVARRVLCNLERPALATTAYLRGWRTPAGARVQVRTWPMASPNANGSWRR